MKSHYFKTKLGKMGKWALMPLDCETWHGEENSKYCRKLFGFPKGILVIFTVSDGYQHAYVPQSYFQKLKSYVKNVNKTNYKALEKKLKTFYQLKPRAKANIEKATSNNFEKLSNNELTRLYNTNRNWIHRTTIYDQFGWIGEHSWDEMIENILCKKLGLKKNSKEYNDAIFTLIKPERISTTLEEKRAVLREVSAIQGGKQTIEKAAGILTKGFSWMPVFTYGVSWTTEKYVEELKTAVQKDKTLVKSELKDLENYTPIRNKEIKDLAKKYNLSERDLQVFIDFGLALDTRNEAEYIVSYGGFYLLPIYKEIAKRLNVSIDELRLLFEKEVIYCLKEKISPKILIKKKGDYIGWGFDRSMINRINFSPEESKELFEYAEKVQKTTDDRSSAKGICASPGKARGRIRIVNTPQENKKVLDGDILVTYATTVDYLPSMKKASAIITEVGGLTCHAAVVSREFGIPCIVSFKDAMTKLKDGVLAEINADDGTVKIL